MTPSEKISLQADIMMHRTEGKKLREKAYQIVKRHCLGNLKDTKKMHEAYRATGMSTSELRTIMTEGAVTFDCDAYKILEMDMKHD